MCVGLSGFMQGQQEVAVGSCGVSFLLWSCGEDGSERVSVTPEVWGIRPVGEGSLIFISNAESCLYHCSVSKQKDKL